MRHLLRKLLFSTGQSYCVCGNFQSLTFFQNSLFDWSGPPHFERCFYGHERPFLCRRAFIKPADSRCWWVLSVLLSDPRGRWLRLHCRTTIQAIEEQTSPRPSVAACTISRRPGWISALFARGDADHLPSWHDLHTDEDQKLTIWVCV